MFGRGILNKKEQKHLREGACTTLAAFKWTREAQRIDEAKAQPGEPVMLRGCFECRMIACKIGLEE